jgi:hypothetical protein
MQYFGSARGGRFDVICVPSFSCKSALGYCDADSGRKAIGVLESISQRGHQFSPRYVHSQGMHVERHFEVIENTGEWRRGGSADFVKLRDPKNLANCLDA